jgi:hypothetical protein
VDVATAIVGGLGTLSLSLGGLVVRGLRNDITSLEKIVHQLDKQVGILIDRDRRRRLEDYEQKESD